MDAISANGLLVKSGDGSRLVRLHATTSLTGSADLVLLTVKSQDVAEACREIAQLQSDATVVTMQNGVRSDRDAAAVLGRDRVVGCVINLSATYREPGVVEQNTKGLLRVGPPFPESAGRVQSVVEVLSRGVRTESVPDIVRARWTKSIANLNNVIMTITGLPIATALRDRGLARLGIATMREGVKTAELGGYRLDRTRRARIFRLMAALPLPLAEVMFGRLAAVEVPANNQFGPSTLQSLQRGSSSELDYLNGEIVTLGQRIGLPTPYNAALLEQGRLVFQTRRFLSPQELLGHFSL